MNIELGKKLQELRKEKGLSQDELADSLHVSRQAVSKWERGEVLPDTENLILLAKLYGVSLDELIGLKYEEKEETKEEDSEEKAEEVEIEILDKTVDVKKVKPHSKKTKGVLFMEWFSGAFTFFLTIAIFITLGLVTKRWELAWLAFFLIPIIPSFFTAIRKKNMRLFCYPVLVLAVYLLIGLLLKVWHPTWIMFISIPLYYIIAEGIDILIGRKTE